jgi:hypothetical protein
MNPFFLLRQVGRELGKKVSNLAGTTPRIDFAAWDVARLADEWRTARPFSHVVIDGLVPSSTLSALREAATAEPHKPNRGEIFDMMGSGETVTHPVLRAFHQSLGSDEALAAVAAVTGKQARSVVMRSFVYLNGSYLLPHTDHREEMGRQIAYAYYLSASGDGGELELFDCTTANDEIVETRSGVRIPAVSNRIVLFDVTPASLHEVREVLGGKRLSLSGWFYS